VVHPSGYVELQDPYNTIIHPHRRYSDGMWWDLARPTSVPWASYLVAWDGEHVIVDKNFDVTAGQLYDTGRMPGEHDPQYLPYLPNIVPDWERYIEQVWNNNPYGIEFSVDFRADGFGWLSDPKYDTRTGNPGLDDYYNSISYIGFDKERGYMVTWESGGQTKYADDRSKQVASHEFGHWLGMYDEYPSGYRNPYHPERVNTGTVMDRNQPVLADYFFDGMLAWRDYKLQADSPPVPLPSSVLLFVSGLLLLVIKHGIV